MPCSHLKTQYESLLRKQEAFEHALNDSIRTGDFSQTQILKQEILEIKASLEPYRNQKLTAHLPKKENPNERELIPIELKETLERSKRMLQEIIDHTEDQDIRTYFTELLQSYPQRIRITEKQKKKLQEDMERHNLRGSLITPRIPKDKRTLFIRGVSGTKIPELEGKTDTNVKSLQYQEPFITDNIEEYEEEPQEETPFSLYLYSQEFVEQDTKKKGLDLLRKIYWRDPKKEQSDPNNQENNEKPQRTTLAGTLMGMREMAKDAAQKNESDPHRYGAWSGNPDDSNAVWIGNLIREITDQDGNTQKHAVCAYRDPHYAQVKVSWFVTDVRSPKIGARPAAIASVL